LDYTAVPLLTGLTSLWFVYWWQQKRQPHLVVTTLLAVTLAMIGYIPWWTEFKTLLERLSDVHIFANFRELLKLPYFSAQHYLFGLFLLAVGLALFFSLLVHWLKRSEHKGLIGWFVAIAFILSLPILVWPRFYTIKRVVVTAWPFIILGVAWSIHQIGSRRRMAIWGLTAVSLLATLVMILAVPKDDWRGVATYLNQHRQPETAVWVDPAWNKIALEYYDQGVPIHKGTIDTLAQLAVADVWLVAERLPSQTAPSSASEDWLDTHMNLVQSILFTRLELRLYRPPH
jgi:hypothetical protein